RGLPRGGGLLPHRLREPPRGGRALRSGRGRLPDEGRAPGRDRRGDPPRRSGELRRAASELVVALRDRVTRVSPPAQRHTVPPQLDVGVVVLALRKLPDPVHEREPFGEVAEAKLPLEGS